MEPTIQSGYAECTHIIQIQAPVVHCGRVGVYRSPASADHWRLPWRPYQRFSCSLPWSSAVLVMDTPAVLDVARFPADGKKRTALLSAQGPTRGTVAGFRWSGGIGCATVPTTPLRNCDFHSALGASAACQEMRLDSIKVYHGYTL